MIKNARIHPTKYVLIKQLTDHSSCTNMQQILYTLNTIVLSASEINHVCLHSINFYCPDLILHLKG